ncbi:MAG: AAA family ATPase [Bacteroidetes bacterium]|nr:AAA family ATPase [Bacteroidota bacterium]
MAIVSILNSKGGVGRTTLATNLAGFLGANGARVLLVDADPQGGCLSWEAARTEPLGGMPEVVRPPKQAIFRFIKRMEWSYDFIVLDSPAGIKPDFVFNGAVKVANLVLVPISPSAVDLWGTVPILERIFAREELGGRDNAEAYFVRSRQIEGSVQAHELAAAAAEFGLPVLAGGTTQNLTYIDAIQLGVTVRQVERGGKADQEMTEITNEVKTILSNQVEDYE